MNSTLTRLQRMLVMVPWLLEHPGVGVEEVAQRFAITVPEVLNDLDVLGYCGLPGYGGGDLIQASVSGGQVVVRMAEFFRRPLALSMREGVSLLLAARAARQSGALGHAVSDGPLASAITKLEHHLGASAEVPVAMDVQAEGQDNLQRLWPAVTNGQVVDLTYWSASKAETTQRLVEPWALRAMGGSWYLQGHCRLAGAPRTFRLDRIRDVRATDEPMTVTPPADLRPPVYLPAEDDPVVVVDVSPQAIWIADLVVLTGQESLQNGWTRLQFQTSTLDWAGRLLLRLGDQARIVQPVELARRRADLAASALHAYDMAPPE